MPKGEKTKSLWENSVYRARMVAIHNLRKSGKMENHYKWKGEKVLYRALHTWVQKVLGKPEKCENCGTDNLSGHKIHWANKNGLYRRKKNDWVRLCTKCHGKHDKRMRSIKKVKSFICLTKKIK